MLNEPMKWTKEKPTKEGKYWYREVETKECWTVFSISISPSSGQVDATTLDGWEVYLNLDFLDGEWSDQPIPEPEEAE